MNGITDLALTKLDVLSGQPTLKMATSYELHGNKLHAMPSNIKDAAAVTPIYEDIPGWQSEIDHIRDFDQLPQEAKDYIRRIEDFTEVPASVVSVGPDREETLLLSNPFEQK